MSSLSSFNYFHGISSSPLILPSSLHPCSKSKMLYVVSFCYPTTTTFPYPTSCMESQSHETLYSLIYYHPSNFTTFVIFPLCFLFAQGSKTRHSKISPHLFTFLITKISSISLSRARVIFLIICSTWRTRNNKTRPRNFSNNYDPHSSPYPPHSFLPLQIPSHLTTTILKKE